VNRQANRLQLVVLTNDLLPAVGATAVEFHANHVAVVDLPLYT